MESVGAETEEFLIKKRDLMRAWIGEDDDSLCASFTLGSGLGGSNKIQLEIRVDVLDPIMDPTPLR